jgi:hypothetical protein
MILRCLALRGWMIAILAFGSNAVAAQDSTETPPTLPPCQTNVGPDGAMLAGYYGMIYAPVAFDRVTAEGSGVTVTDLRDGLGVLSALGFVPMKKGAQPPLPVFNAAGEPVVRLRFVADTDTVVHACEVHVVTFDPAQYNMARMRIGTCDARLVAGMPELWAGHAQVWQSRGRNAGNFVARVKAMDTVTLDDDLVLQIGQVPGVAQMVWAQNRQDGTLQISLCPLEVVAATVGDAPRPIDDQYLCKDPQGKPLRLTAGEVATVRPLKADGSAFETTEYMLQEPEIAKATGFDKAYHGPIVQGVAAGSTSVVMLGFESNKQVALVCEVVVE